MTLTNIEMDEYLQALRQISTKVTGRFAYAVARNIRKISEELVEYQNLKDNAIKKYGEHDENGRFSIQRGTEAFENFATEMKEYTDISHEVQIQMITQEDLGTSILNANEILMIDFMIKEESTE